MKLPTKALIGLLAAFTAISLVLFLVAIPWVRGYLLHREVSTARTYLGLASLQVRSWMDELYDQRRTFSALGLPPEDVETLMRQREANIYRRLDTLYAGFTLNDSGRLFLIDSQGRFVVPGGESKPADPNSRIYAFDTPTRGALIARITAPGDNLTRELDYDVLDRDRGVVKRRLFTSPVPGTSYYLCLAVDLDDLSYSADLAGRSMNLVLVATLLVLLLLSLWFYRRLNRRYTQVMNGAARILEGHYDRPILDPSSDEIGILAQTIDALAANMREKERLERQIRQIQRLELVGSLASGVTHEFNNILTGIRSGLDLSLEMLRDEPIDMSGIQDALSIVQNCAARGRETVERLSTFFRDNTSNRQLLDFNRLVQDAVDLCRHSLDRTTNLQVNTPPTRQVVEVDRNLIEQVIMNLMLNARDALEGKPGSITVDVGRHRPSDLHPPDGQAVSRDYVSVSVSDTGIGIPPELSSRIFDPYFTTKELGTGLGLSIAFKIVREHGGWITVDSKPRHGSVFHVYLPTAHRDLSDSQVLRIEPRRERPAPAGRLLLALPASRETVELQKALSTAGYDALLHSNRMELQQDLEASDVRMLVLSPELAGLSGAGDIAALRDAAPRTHFLLLVDGKRDPRIADFLAAGCDNMLSRPFTFRELDETLRAAMTAPRQAPDAATPN